MAKSRSLNKVFIIGNLTRDPVLKNTGNGFKVCTFGVATNSKWKDATGGEKERAEFHNIVAWNKLAEVCAQLLTVGMLVHLEGELRTREIKDASGESRYRTEIKLDDMILLDSKGKAGIGVSAAETLGQSTSELPVDIEEEPAGEMKDDDIIVSEDLF